MMTPQRLTRELDARLSGPHAAEHTAGTAGLAAECIRFLNYATGSHADAGIEFPSTVYEITADLKLAAGRMPQLFDQLRYWLGEQLRAGMLGTDTGHPADPAVSAAWLHLTVAANHASKLAAALDDVQNDLAMVNGRGPNRAERAA
jgi:hypothetical protein